MRRISVVLAVVLLACGIAVAPRFLSSRTTSGNDFVHFESQHVHPACLTPSRQKLLVVNTPDDRLTVFDVSDTIPHRDGEIFVGLEPVSVCAVDDSTAWVVNQLSDDISVVNLNTMHVKATLRVGDEPGDVVFAGSPLRAYVSVGGEDAVKVYDPANLATPPTVIALAASEPRALAVKADGSKVYVALFGSGNHTSLVAPTKIPNDSFPEDFDMPTDPGLLPVPKVGLVVQSQGSTWFDMYGNPWNSHVKYQVREADVIEINTASNTVARTFGGFNSTVMALTVNPADSRVFYAGTEARNVLRFEPRITGYTVETNMVFVNQSTGVQTLRKMNPHINFDVSPGTQAEADSALGTPTGVAFSSAGNRAYVAAYANNRIGVLNPSGGAASTVLARVPVVAGPTGIVVDDAMQRIFVVGRFHNELQTLSTVDFHQFDRTRIGYDPTPDPIVNGRKFFYGGFTSSHGEQSCASCHVFGDTDNLAWDLGDPNGSIVGGFHPMKGPLVTQSLRGLSGTAPFHWRGDRPNLAAFNGAFVSLMGRPTQLADSEMTAMSDFVMPLAYPPNPNENLDRTMPDAPLGQGSALRGQSFFSSTVVDSGKMCSDCHTVASFGPGTNRHIVSAAHLAQSQSLKVPQLRNLYKKTSFLDQPGALDKRGFGYTHDGSVDQTSNFDHGPGFVLGPDSATAADNQRDLAAYVKAFDTGMAPAVGYQLTFDGTNNSDPTALATVDTLTGQADATNCDLVAHGRVAGQARAWQYVGAGEWKPDKAAQPNITTNDLIALAGLGTELTLTGVPPGSGVRMALDRDRDTYFDGDELDAGSNPGDPASTPVNVGVESGQAPARTGLQFIGPNPFHGSTDVAFTLARAGKVDVVVYDVLGRQVRALARNRAYEAGRQTLRWDGRDDGGRAIGAGVYFVRMKTDVGSWSRSVVHVR